MNIELDNEQSQILHCALEAYLSSLRQEIGKTDKYEWRIALRHEKEILADIQKKLA